MKSTSILILTACMLSFSSCSLLRLNDGSSEESEDIEEVVVIENTTEEIAEVVPTRAIYNPSETRVHDLLHTRLEVSFDYDKQYLFGLAELTLKPYFYPSDQLTLDAKGFDINSVTIFKEKGKEDLNYTYDGAFIEIQLDTIYTRDDTYKIEIEYVAKPNELEVGGSAAITSDKGLYFINPLGDEEGKPTQIWTQGETESSSCWFPTIDAPNERMTQEIFMRVDENYKTLSNGDLIYSNYNDDGTRTDYWNMELPHAPYLAMMAIGEYRMALDKWINEAGEEIPVLYFIEDEYADYVYNIFGNTPEMMDFYSDLLGYEYPWSKYGQVIVRDYVSGAMENTTATVHGEFLNATDRELLDGDYEDVIAHELFHQWFGDLVTCENWANLPLNESFATYGEYLWKEYKYGKDAADYHAKQSMDGYFQEAGYQKKRMIRFAYGDKEDMFDAHSYNKGGRILHMLRNYVGDEAFFASLNKYLVDNAYTAVEIHNLRLAFEEVTGEDLNWFFDQWFLNIGHPVLEITYDWDQSTMEQVVMIKQTQDVNSEPIFKLPFAIDVYEGTQLMRYDVVLDEVYETFRFKCDMQPSWVNVDGDKMLLARKDDRKNDEWWVQQYYNGTNYMDRFEAVTKGIELGGELFDQMITSALNDPFKEIKLLAMTGLDQVNISKNGAENTVRKLVFDSDANVRSAAISALGTYFPAEDNLSIFEGALTDRSYSVMASGLTQMTYMDQEKGLAECKKYEGEDNYQLASTVEYLYSAYGSAEHHDYFKKRAEEASGFSLYNLASNYGMYLANQEDNEVDEGLPILEDIAGNQETWWIRLSGLRSLATLEDVYAGQLFDLNKELEVTEDSGQRAQLDQAIMKKKAMKTKIAGILSNLKSNESDQRVLGRI